MKKLLTRIHELTKVDLQHKSLIELLACPVEELGELCRELKIEFGTFGNTYKKPDEGSKAEAIDLFIGATCMCFVGTAESCPWFHLIVDAAGIADCLQLQNTSLKSTWGIFADATKNIGTICTPKDGTEQYLLSPLNAVVLAQDAINIFFSLGGTAEEFFEIANKKLNKWEATQGKLCTPPSS